MDKQLLQSYIKRYDGVQRNLAEALGISLSRLNAKINGTSNAEFTQSEMATIKERYHLNDKVFNQIFFANLVS